MSVLVSLLVILVIFALVYWVIEQLTLPPPIRMVAIVIFAIVALFWLLSLVGSVPSLHLHLR